MHPAGDTIPAQDGLIGRLVVVGTPTISVSYADDATNAPIPGTFWLQPGEISSLWTFTPRAPLTVGRTVRAVVRGSTAGGPTDTRDFLVSSSTVAAPPSFAGVGAMQVILSRFANSLGGTCDIGPEQSRVVFPSLPAPSAGSPLYRYYFYRQGTPPPAEPTLYGTPDRFLSQVICGGPRLRCQADVPMRFQAGEVWCARVEAADLMGHRSGYDVEACATVVAEDVEVTELGSMVSCTPVAVAPDAGLPAPDAGASTVDAGTVTAADAGTADVTDADGCTCVRPRSGGAQALVVGLLALAWVGRRRRARA